MSVKIRDYTSDDFTALRDLMWAYREELIIAAAARSDVVERFYPHTTYDQAIYDLPDQHSGAGRALLVAEHEQVIGCAMLVPVDQHKVEIKRIYVSAAARGLGTARQLIETAMQRARAHGYTEMVLDTLAPLHSARRLYAAQGFREIPPFYTPKGGAEGFVLYYGRTL